MTADGGRRLDQLLPVLDPGDAASNHTLQVQQLLRDCGFESDIFCQETHPTLANAARPMSEYPGGPVIHQFAIGSLQADRLLAEDQPLALVSHNVTPPEFFEVWDPPLVHGCAWGRNQLARLAPRCSIGIGVSRFNEADLVAFGCGRTAVAPILLDTKAFEREPDPATHEALATLKLKGGTDWLFVGRLVPNKAQHDVLKAFAVYRRRFEPTARLWLVGGASSARYEAALRGFARAAGLSSAVTFTGPVSPGALAAHYGNADVFVCLSDHEGFCVPLLEAMHHGVPIVAFGATAVPETLGTGGVCLPEKHPTMVASTVARVVDDRALRDQLVAAGHARLADFALDRTRARFAAVIEPWYAEVTA